MIRGGFLMKMYANEKSSAVLSIYPFSEIGFERSYSFSSLCFIFFSFSMAGWLWEVFLHIIIDGRFINRGVLFGPWLPIYGCGSVLILLVLRRWRSQPLRTFGLILLLCGTLEYFSGLFLETFFHAKWWDYSDMILNLHGRVCLEGLIIFGIGGLVLIYFAAPRMDSWFQKLAPKARVFLCWIFSALFLFDLIRSILAPNMGFGITA